MAEREPTPVRPAPNTNRTAFKGDSTIPTGPAPGEPLDKTLRHLDYRRAGGLPPTEKTFVGPISGPQVQVPESERRDRR